MLPMSPSATGHQLHHACAALYGFKPSRILISVSKNTYLNQKQEIEKQIETSEITLKYIGPQISYRLVFMLEYMGPLLISTFLFSSTPQVYFWIFHFSKRILETMFVHEFSNATMPIRNVFKNCAYYYGFSFFVLVQNQVNFNVFWGVCFIISEFLNGFCHIHLRLIRSGKKGYQNPSSLLFKYVACPNYTFELLSWVCFGLSCSNARALIFAIFGYGQIRVWGYKKQERLNELFPESRRKFAVFPVFGL
eukprot:EST43544.1 3-oxo-5-alpha-steroid 4-dehydrogenase family protein [Spironucleus salmonicida]